MDTWSSIKNEVSKIKIIHLKTIPLIKDYDIEAKFVNDNIIDMVEYFKKEDNVNIYVIGESPINSLIPRININ